jgi:hypothetical protein
MELKEAAGERAAARRDQNQDTHLIRLIEVFLFYIWNQSWWLARAQIPASRPVLGLKVENHASATLI